MSGLSAIDLSKLPSPKVIEPLDFQTIFNEMLGELQTRLDDFDALIESDPVYKLLEVAAYRELILRARINDACQSVMLAYAKGNDLDHLAAFFNVKRQLIDEGNQNAILSVAKTFESDDRLRQRTQLSLEGHSTAGSVGSYIFHALAASPLVKDVTVASPAPGRVTITILSTEANGDPSDEVIDSVKTKLNAKEVRPLTDLVEVKKPSILRYKVIAELLLEEGPDAELVRKTSEKKVWEYVRKSHRLGQSVALSGLYAALHQEGVDQVILELPAADVIVASNQAPWCYEVIVTIGDKNG